MEKYLSLFLKIEAIILGAKFLYIKNIFYYIDYITHIYIGHGVSILKQFLYSPKKYYGNKRYNNIIIATIKNNNFYSKKHGWTDIL